MGQYPQDVGDTPRPIHRPVHEDVTFTHKPDECVGVSVIPLEKVEIISKGGFFSTSSGQEILLIQHRVEEKRRTAALMDIPRYR